MATVKERVDAQGRVSIKKILNGTNIRPGDLVEVVPDTDKVVLKIVKKDKPKGVIERVAGKWKNRPDIVGEILNIRQEEDRDVPELG